MDSLRTLANRLQEGTEYARAEPVFRALIEAQSRLVGEKSLDVANSLNNLANNLRDQGRDEEAGRLFRKSLELRQLLLPPDDSDLGASINNLAVHLHDLGKFDEAVPLAERALGIFRKSLGEKHAYVAVGLSNLALIRQDQAQFDKAEKLFREALALNREINGPDHESVGRCLVDLANLHLSESDYVRAEPLLEDALTILRARLGPTHHEVGNALLYLADVRRFEGRFGQAESLITQARNVITATLGEDHPDVGGAAECLASVRVAEGRWLEADSLYRSALVVEAKRLGPDHQGIGRLRSRHAACLQLLGLPREAFQEMELAMKVEQTNVRRAFTGSSEIAMRDYVTSVSGSLDQLLSLVLEIHPLEPADVDSAYAWVLRRKTVLVDALLHYRQAQRAMESDSAVARRVGELRVIQRRLADLYGSPRQNAGAAGNDSVVAVLRAVEEEREAELHSILTKHNSRNEMNAVSVEAVREALPGDAALVEYVRMRTFDPGRGAVSTAWSAPRYLAFVSIPGNGARTQLVDLGDAEQIDGLVAAMRRGLKAEDEATESMAKARRWSDQCRALYQRIFAPVARVLRGSRTVYLAPDGELNWTPFDALIDDNGRFLVEDYRFSYLSSGSELLDGSLSEAIAGAAGDPRGTVIFADANFDLAGNAPLASAMAFPGAGPGAVAEPFRGARSADASDVRRWERLPASAREAEDIRRALSGSRFAPVEELLGDLANEAALKNLKAPVVLHIATHGYFFPSQSTLTTPASGAGDQFVRHSILGDDALAHVRGTENPLVRCGIVLSGANTIPNASGVDRRDDGWVTAEEMGTLDLDGTELVVLSACDTALGAVRTGEGVIGLRRSLRFAGTRSIVMSVAPVGDTAARALMAAFYSGLSSGLGKRDSLREAKLRLLHDALRRFGDPRPAQWAGFEVFGSPN